MLIQSTLSSLEKELSKAKDESIGAFGIFLLVLLVLGICFGLACFGWWIGMLLWNYILCTVWGFTALHLTFWQFAGFDILCGMLFKSSVTTTKSKD